MSEPTTVVAEPARVTYFEDRAEVTRAVRATLPARLQYVRIAGVTPLVDDPSVHVRVVGGAAEVVSVSVGRRVLHDSETAAEAAQAHVDEAEERLAEAERAGERAGALAGRLARLWEQWVAAAGQVSRLDTAGGADAWAAVLRRLLDDGRAAGRASAQAAAAVADARQTLDRAQARQDATSGQPIPEAHVDAQLDVAEGGDVELEVTYRTPCALWRPEHLARLEVDPDDPGRGTVEITTWATAWQDTGEHWAEVDAAFSTTRPAQDASPPLLVDDVLVSREKSREERRVVHVQQRDLTIEATGVDGARRVDAMPGIDDAGRPLTYTAAGPTTVPSDGQPHRVELRRVRFPVQVALTMIPELVPAAHLTATGTLPTGDPLLAGPVRLVRQRSMVGRGRVGYVAPGEPFELGFGIDDGLRVRRLATTQQDTKALGGNALTHEVRLYLSNMSQHERTVSVTERVPVSEIQGVSVTMHDGGGFSGPDPDGFATAAGTLAGGATHELQLRYTIYAKSNIALSG